MGGTICRCKMFFPLLLLWRLLLSSALPPSAWQPAPPGIEKPHILSTDELTTPRPEPCTEGSATTTCSACKQQLAYCWRMSWFYCTPNGIHRDPACCYHPLCRCKKGVLAECQKYNSGFSC